jgi:S-DNA-T family DNA segregation ATPase FtsK/SpoIIIE
MSHPLMLGALAATAAGVPAWRHFAPRSFWFLAAFPIKAVRVYLTWAHVTASCGLASRRRRWRWTIDAVPVAGSIARTGVLLTQRRRVRRVEVPDPPGLGVLRPNVLGWSVRVRLREGQVPADYVRAAEQLAHAWRVHAVRVTASSPGRVRLLATRTDPLTTVSIAPEAGELLTVRPGMLETGQPWVIDFRTVLRRKCAACRTHFSLSRRIGQLSRVSTEAGTVQIGTGLIVVFWVVVEFFMGVGYGIYKLASR